MTATNAKPARPELLTLKQALRAHQTCSDAAVKALQDLLGAAGKQTSAQDKENVRPKNAQDAKATSRPRSKTKTKTDLAAAYPALSPREKFLLATEVVNSSLKALSDALKPQPKSNSRIASTTTEIQCSRAASTASESKRQPAQRAPSQISNDPVKSTSVTKSSSNPPIKSGPPANVVALAECARLAFAYLRTSDAWKTSGKDIPALQLETGMLSLVGKLLSHGLEALAAKELRAVKRRLETYLRPTKEGTSSVKQESEQAEKETLASLLSFGEIDQDSPALQLAVNHQLYVLKIIASSKRPATVESALEWLERTSPSSPINLLLHLAQQPVNKEKAARQLESVAQIILSLCPSISTSEDSAARTATASPSPDIVFKLQALAFETRSKWWTLSGHKGDAQTELLEPFCKCLATFSRRSGLTPSETYNLAMERLEILENSTGVKARDRKLCTVMSSLAQAANLGDEAMKWLKNQPASSKGRQTSDAARAATHIRIATLSLDSRSSSVEGGDLDANIDSALESLEGSLRGDAGDLDSLLTEVSSLRKAASKAFVDAKDDPVYRDKYFTVVSACVHFLARYIGTRPPEGSDAQAFIRHGERLHIASRAVKGFLDSAIACCKASISSEAITWDALDGILEDCRFILYEIEAIYMDNPKQLQQFSSNLGRPIVKLSGLYWLFFAYLRKKNPSGEGLLHSLRRSVEILLDRPGEEKAAGLLLLKLEKLGEVLEELRKYDEAEKAYTDSIRTQIESGALQEAAERASAGSLQQVMLEGRSASFLKTATSLHMVLLRQSQKADEKPLFFDMAELEPAERSVLLEVQLILCGETYAKSRKPSVALCNSIRDAVQHLFELYSLSEHPLRRQRVATHVLRLGVDCQNILGEDLFSEVTACEIKPSVSLGSDVGLGLYQEHYSASHSMSIALLKSPPSADEVQGPLLTWQGILDGMESWSQLLCRIDAFEVWMSQLQMASDFLGMKGLDFLRLPVLSIMSKGLELQQPPNYGKLIQALASLGAQYVRLGYSGKAGTVLGKAQVIVETGDVPTEAVLQWQLAYAEYMLVLGNLEKCGETLSAAHKLAENDPALLAEASHLYSLLSLSSGFPTEALAYAKQCVNLNKKIWLTVENRKVRSEVSSENEIHNVTDGLSKMSVQSNIAPLTISMTHGALTGAAFWSFVPSIFRGLSQLASVFAHQGMLQEAVYFSEQASKVAAAVEAAPFAVQNLSTIAQYYLESNRLDDASDCLDKANLSVDKLSPCIDLAVFYSTGAQFSQLIEKDDDAVEKYDKACSILQSLSKPTFIQSLEHLSAGEAQIVDKISSTSLEEPATGARKAPAKTAKAKKTSKTVTKITARKTPAATPPPQKMAHECPPLEGIQATILCRKAALLIARNCLSEAVALIEKAAEMKLGQEAAVQHQSTRFRSLMSEAMREIAADFTFNALPESTISFPALSRGDRKLSEPSQARPSYLSIAEAPSPVAPASKKGTKGRKAAKEDVAALLKKARDCIAEVQSQAVHTSSTSAVQRVCSMLNEVTILLSATTPKGVKGSLHPLYAAYLTELPKTNASQLEQLAISIENQAVTREDLMTWPGLTDDQQRPAQLTAAEFQTEYVNTIPQGWTAVSLSLNEARDELYITRYVPYQSPFILRLPMARHNSRDMDEEIFGFEEGKAELREIIDLSNFSTRNAPDLSKKGAKTEWWAEREALDARLGDLLANIENIWLGGFRGIFKKKGDRSLLSRFQQSFENILDRHLPSRQGKGKKSRTNLDSRVLELFVGLGNPDDGVDLDEPLMDLVYFVVDILQFNGERNAYDEIDFDSIIIEMLDALRAFHEAAEPTPNQHTILILDKNLHAFPWESLPSLQSLSISRLPSMSALRERLIAARASKHSIPEEEDGLDANAGRGGGHHITLSSLTGTSILNPAGDLQRTQDTLVPHLESTPGSWNHLIGRIPDEKMFESSLASKDVLLYFGHGSGAQYIRGRTVKKLLCRANNGKENAKEDERNPLATALLFGCSSAHVTDNGAFEPSGMLCAYLTAGVPAVLGMLWDVTDKDCDRFAVATLQKWGLFGNEEDDIGGVEPKTPGRKRGAAGAKTPSKSRSRSRGKGGMNVAATEKRDVGERVALDEAVARSRGACYLKYLNGAAAVVYGIPVFLD
ncbi:Peptidase C50 separase [Macrophomina phaseolina MS6]|uniref:separase n=1 Tax=Macrophomina phaseolina (strain MS6) TaxID=1126212 RepID=K2R7J5_MACPH|nr:Peptidase C50 separase [Macrophomina phaseolina MS6]